MLTNNYVAYVARCGCEYTILTVDMTERWMRVTVCREHNRQTR
jgi:hypothetical protein